MSQWPKVRIYRIGMKKDKIKNQNSELSKQVKEENQRVLPTTKKEMQEPLFGTSHQKKKRSQEKWDIKCFPYYWD